MNRNNLYIIIAVLAAGILVAGYLYYQERQQTSGIDIKIGEGSISVETK